MKKLITLLVFIMFASIGTHLLGQSNGPSGGSQNWPPAIGESSTACGSSNNLLPQAPGSSGPVIGEGWPMNRVVHILQIARPYFQQQSGLNLGQMIQAYNQCSCVIRYLGEGRFRVTIGGVLTEIGDEF